MILRRVMEHLRRQDWTAVAIEFVIVVLGVFVATQVSNWNEEREAAIRRDQVVALLVADLRDGQGAQAGFERDIAAGVARWQERFDAGELPPPAFSAHRRLRHCAENLGDVAAHGSRRNAGSGDAV